MAGTEGCPDAPFCRDVVAGPGFRVQRGDVDFAIRPIPTMRPIVFSDLYGFTRYGFDDL